MSRLALIGVTGAAVVVVAAGLIYSIGQQEGDDSGDNDTPPVAENGTATVPAATSEAVPSAASPVGTSAQTAGAAAPATGTAVVANDAAQGAAAAPTAPSFDVVRVNPNGDAVIAGRAKPGASVTLLDDGKVIGSAKADDRGEWVLLPNSSIAPGEHKFTLQAQGEGGAAEPSERMVIVVVPAPAKDIAGNAVSAPAGALALSVPQSGEGPSEILNMPSTGSTADLPKGPVREPTLDVVDFDKEGRMALAGRAAADSKVALYLDDKLMGSATVDPQGRWRFVPADKLSIGRHELRVDQVDANNKVTARIAQPIEQPDFAALTPGDAQIVVQPGNSLWRLARRTYGEGLQYSVIYEANKDRVRDPDLIYPGQVLTLPQ
ncbi:LysM peptidoglycan-binding domain-containing protein [Dongia rigui]|uniref:LysM peptidoglycan-binding domain-containing protein n=1 Tax=Dongia rigui TaxID=940149 RepID=A0ABU5DSZ4_9PROT|nr:LysM peptidoglycan-binding domain-containing protein [Dongia rigui]MDY0870475.1 LysM peptidoglycan-binding domain-containing protein [Dongia rigui]